MLSEEHRKLAHLNAELNGQMVEVNQSRMVEVDLVNIKTAKDNRIQELQVQIDVLIS